LSEYKYKHNEKARVKMVRDSWRGVRPVIHYSYSRCEHLPDVVDKHSGLHDMSRLLALGCKKQKLRAHSDYYPNPDVNAWALSFWPEFDIQCEAKAKNLAQKQLYEEANI
jgi:UV DNA damage endonuclease